VGAHELERDTFGHRFCLAAPHFRGSHGSIIRSNVPKSVRETSRCNNQLSGACVSYRRKLPEKGGAQWKYALGASLRAGFVSPVTLSAAQANFEHPQLTERDQQNR
jgi:hypothetical protein